MPICVYIEMDCDMMMQPMMVPRMAVGIDIITATGSVQLSYWAASTRRVMMTANNSTVVIVVPDWVS